MRYFTTPFDQETPDKVVGGKLTAKQLVCYSPVIFMVFIITSSSEFVLIKFLIEFAITVILLILGSIFAFVKKDGDELDKYLIKLIKFKLRNKTSTYHKY
ncbi:hypothetical protein SH1V18_47900 [Vallitalea longa]|uniref:PrgI family protein n=1 Tax=Vallitalea longa TaxID=2936439 RepID=A0A9W6DH53_9FIRM|nr:PrgI family protein [Vallitalea longa]GKX32310.1 hypothetical protein SH1V18_47900 [Vallitalea longa]